MKKALFFGAIIVIYVLSVYLIGCSTLSTSTITGIDLSASPSSGAAPLTVDYTVKLCLTTYDGQVICTMLYGDGASSLETVSGAVKEGDTTTRYYSHVYSAAGTYLVTYEANGIDTGAATKHLSIIVSASSE